MTPQRDMFLVIAFAKPETYITKVQLL
uniref:Uncharacterized protein n=1 Tax=Arundo donax TaxID=35708 RepID=A0A0A9AIW7_ARUDO